MKPSLVALIVVVSLMNAPLTAWAEGVSLIGKDVGNGNFEEGTMGSWGGGTGENPEKVTPSAKTGDYVFHVRVMGKSGGRATGLVYQKIKNVDPINGRNFAVKFDTKVLADHMNPSFSVELLTFNNDAVGDVVLFSGEEEYANDSEWVSHVLTSTKPVGEDWLGGKIQLRIIFYQDNGNEGESYELLVDNVQLIQMQ